MAKLDKIAGKPYNEMDIKLAASRNYLSERDICIMCLNPIKIQIFKNSGVCSELCRKDRDDDHEPWRGGVRTP